MFLQNLRARMNARLSGDREAGFTLIELLVVMLILGILAAIAIPAFFNQRDKATDAEAKAMARSAETAMETYATEHGGKYEGTPEPSGAVLHAIEPTIEAAKVTVTKGSNTFTVTAKSDLAGHEFSITRNADGTKTLSCVPKEANAAGGCPPSGNWGQ
jgi:type IV pilus assembly protein PilA